jgi:hypothetical protein
MRKVALPSSARIGFRSRSHRYRTSRRERLKENLGALDYADGDSVAELIDCFLRLRARRRWKCSDA